MLYAIIPLVLIFYLAAFKVNKLKKYRMVLFLAFITLAIGIPILDIIKLYSAVPRPWILYLDINSLYHGRGTSFPSGHAFQAFAGTLPIIICFLTSDGYFKRNNIKIALAILLLIFAISLSFSRILAGMHFLTDVLFGIGLAMFLMVLLAVLLKWLLDTGNLNLKNEKWHALVFTILIVLDLIYL
ncbi:MULTISPECIES: phosphatase PAP2 family protein [Methanobacterium]|nr:MULTISPECIES: phosphatase PAP2 family protein [Methanobacterium]MCZ3374002.1 phosphatase PAP2 family protein [Methanobacterium veterum]